MKDDRDPRKKDKGLVHIIALGRKYSITQKNVFVVPVGGIIICVSIRINNVEGN
jgi:hypothetical protein